MFGFDTALYGSLPYKTYLAASQSTAGSASTSTATSWFMSIHQATSSSFLAACNVVLRAYSDQSELILKFS